LGLVDPIVPCDPASKGTKLCIYVRHVSIGPVGDLRKAGYAKAVEQIVDLGAQALDQLKIVRD
jgi:hypothetical protein